MTEELYEAFDEYLDENFEIVFTSSGAYKQSAYLKIFNEGLYLDLFTEWAAKHHLLSDEL